MSYSPAHEADFSILSFYGPTLEYYLYVYDSTDDATTNYDHVVVSPSKDGSQAVAVLGAGDWSDSVDVSISGIRAEGQPQYAVCP